MSSNGYRISKIVTMYDIKDNMRNAFFKDATYNFLSLLINNYYNYVLLFKEWSKFAQDTTNWRLSKFSPSRQH